MVNKKELTTGLGLSCVEKYFLAWLEKYYKVSNLYVESYISLNQVFNDFAHGAMYQNYCYIPRVQDVAEDYGIVEHKYFSCSANEALNMLFEAKDDDLCLIRVNTNFFVNFKRSSWREDHYICIEKDLRWINEYPLTEGTFTIEEFTKIFDGGLCVYKVKDVSILPINDIPNKYRSLNVNDIIIPKSIKSLQDAVGVLRVTRKRLLALYKENNTVKALLENECELLDKLFFNLQLQLIKGVKTKEIENQNIENLNLIFKIEESIRGEIASGEQKYNR